VSVPGEWVEPALRSILGLPHIGTYRTWSTEVTPARGDNEKHASASERNACHNRSRRTHLEGRDLSGDKPDTGKQDQQEAELGECDARLVAERKHGSNGSYLDRSVLPTTERDLLCSQDYLAVWGSPRVGRSGAGPRHALTKSAARRTPQ
jgi:hypothetical protein